MTFIQSPLILYFRGGGIMKKLSLIFLFTTSLVFADMIIVGSPSCRVQSISKTELKSLYLGLSSSLDNQQIIVTDRDSKELYEAFADEYLKKSPLVLKTYWARMLFTGKAKPPKQISYAQLATLENANGCQITYIAKEEYKSGLKRLSIVE